MVRMKDGTEVTDPRLGRLIQFDESSRAYAVREVLPDKPLRSYTWRCMEWHDQGVEGACTWFALGHDIAARPLEILRYLNFEYLRNMYWETQKIDEWAGGAYPGASPRYEGTSTLAALKIAKREGWIKEYRWAFDLRELILALGWVGPVVMGSWWKSGMWNVGPDGFVKVEGRNEGGHAYLARAVAMRWPKDVPITERTFSNLDLDASYVTCRNSWGKHWGMGGDFRVTLRGLDQLRREDGEAAIPIMREDARQYCPPA